MQFQTVSRFLVILLPFTALAVAQSEHIKHHHKKLEHHHRHNSTMHNRTYCQHMHCSTATATGLPTYATNTTVLVNGAESSLEVKREFIMVGGIIVGAFIVGLGL